MEYSTFGNNTLHNINYYVMYYTYEILVIF